MPLFENTAVGTATALAGSLTYDPFQPGTIGATTQSADETSEESTLVANANQDQATNLIIRVAGNGYNSGNTGTVTGVAVTNVTAANNDYIPLAADGGGTTSMQISIRTEDGIVREAWVTRAANPAYDGGMEVTVNGNGANDTDCLLMIPFEPQG